jgi:excisionase family DNA binding protein
LVRLDSGDEPLRVRFPIKVDQRGCQPGPAAASAAGHDRLEVMVVTNLEPPSDMESGDRLLSTKEAAAFLGVSVRHLTRMISAKDLPAVRLSERVLRVKYSDLVAYVEAHRTI